MNKKITLLALAFCLFSGITKAQVSITSATPYTQDFNTLPATGSSTTNPSPANWWRYAPTAGTATINVTSGTSNAGGFYSTGTGTNTDRSLGTLYSSSARPLYAGVKFINNTGSTIVSATVSYKCEQWRRGNTNAGLADTLLFEYTYTTDSINHGTWTNVSALVGSSTNTTTTTGALDGNAVFKNVSGTISGLVVPAGGSFWIRFSDFDVSPGSDDILSVDDFSIAFTTGTVAACTTPASSAINLVANQTGTTSIAGSFSSTTADGFLVLLDSNATQPTVVNGTAYTVGQLVGTSVVISNSAATTFSKNGLIPNTVYRVWVFPYNNAGCTGGPNYKQAPVSSDTAKTLIDACPEPTAEPTNLVFTNVTNTTITGKFNKAVPAPNGGYVVVFSTSSNTGIPLDSTSYSVGDSINYSSFKSKVIAVGTDSNFSVSGLVAGTRYYFVVVPFNTCGGFPNYNRTTPLRDDTTTTGTAPLVDCVQPSGVSNTSIIKLDSTATTITIKWTKPANADSVLVAAGPLSTIGFVDVRDSAYYAVGSTIPGSNAKVYFRGTDSTVILTGLTANTVYKIVIATFNNKNCTNGPNYSGLANTTIKTANTITGIKTRNAEAEFSIYPNPTNTGLLSVKFNNQLKEDAVIEVVDILGQKLTAQKVSNGTGFQTIDVSNFAKGTYILNVVYKGENNVSTFIVQ